MNIQPQNLSRKYLACDWAGKLEGKDVQRLIKCVGDCQEISFCSLSRRIAEVNCTTPNKHRQEMTFCTDKTGPQMRRQILCQVCRLSTATMTDNISHIKGQPNTQMLLLENYILELSIWVSQLPSSPHGCPRCLARALDQTERGWAPRNKPITAVNKKKLESQVYHKIA